MSFLAESVDDAALRRGIKEGHGVVHEAEEGLAVQRPGPGQGGEVEEEGRHHGGQALQQAQPPVHRQVQVPAHIGTYTHLYQWLRILVHICLPALGMQKNAIYSKRLGKFLTLMPQKRYKINNYLGTVL